MDRLYPFALILPHEMLLHLFTDHLNAPSIRLLLIPFLLILIVSNVENLN
jgi:hypothetical protein